MQIDLGIPDAELAIFVLNSENGDTFYKKSNLIITDASIASDKIIYNTGTYLI